VIDPWEDYDTGELFGGDHLYAGDREVIEDLILLTEVCIAFELWVDDFRYWDRNDSPHPLSRWEEDSPFSETTSIRVSMAPRTQQ